VAECHIQIQVRFRHAPNIRRVYSAVDDGWVEGVVADDHALAGGSGRRAATGQQHIMILLYSAIR